VAERDPDWAERSRNYPAFEQDYAAWIAAQIGLLRAREFDALDLDNLLDEVEGLARSDFKAFVSAIRIVMVHMLKWDIQTDLRSRSWARSIDEHRRRVLRDLEDSPSYRGRLDQAVIRAYERARYDASLETRLPLDSFPPTCPFTFEDVMEREHTLDM
jgi:hypothetical protein